MKWILYDDGLVARGENIYRYGKKGREISAEMAAFRLGRMSESDAGYWTVA